MKRSLPTGRTGQMLALGLTLALPLAMWLGAIGPLLAWHADRAEALGQREALARHILVLQATLPTLRQQASTIAASGAGEPALLDGESNSVASAFLQERLQAMFVQAGVQLNSVETLPGDDAGPYRRIRLQLAFNANWSALMELLKDIHGATLALLIDELHVQPALHRISTAPGTFDVSCVVFAFRSSPMRVTVR